MSELFTHRGHRMIRGTHVPHEVDQISDLELRDSDVFVVTFPKSGEALDFFFYKVPGPEEEQTLRWEVVLGFERFYSGTIWMQQILLLLKSKGDLDSICEEDTQNGDLVPWIEIRGKVQEFVRAESPRYNVTHLPFHLMPQALRRGTGKVIYVARNPKDVLVSFYHFSKIMSLLETPQSFEEFFDRFLRGDVAGGSWFEHVKSWFSHKDQVNMLFLTYEEMIQDLQAVVRRIAEFLGVDLTQDQLSSVVKHSTFRNMKRIPRANYTQLPSDVINHEEGSFMRRGTIGDWKNHFTVAQNERFDQVFEQEMKDFPVSFIWDV